eukprot:764658-Hanusia_phi.AAC.9
MREEDEDEKVYGREERKTFLLPYRNKCDVARLELDFSQSYWISFHLKKSIVRRGEDREV